MTKRSLTIAIIGVLAVGLVAGSVYVVLRPEEVHAEGSRGGRWNETAVTEARGADLRDLQNDKRGYGRGEAGCDEDCDEEHHKEQAREIVMGRGREASDLLDRRGGGGYSSDRGRAMGEVLGQSEGGSSGSQNAWYAGEDLEWVTVEGQVLAIDGGDLTLLSSDGREILCGTGPEWYWDESGHQVNVGDELRVTGCDHDDEFAVGQIENLTTGEVITLRDEQGRPGWAGRGWRKES